MTRALATLIAFAALWLIQSGIPNAMFSEGYASSEGDE